MARKDEYGRYVISAGEVGSYVVCPEAWRLSKVCQVHAISNSNMQTGNELHNEWGKELEQVRYFSRTIKITLGLLAFSAVFYLFRGILQIFYS